MRALPLALGVAAANVALGWWLGLGAFDGLSRRRALVQAAGFLGRAGLVFLAAHLLWLSGRRAGEVALFIVATALLQLAGQGWLGRRWSRRGEPW